jgi:YVTN family beta-propeller protein
MAALLVAGFALAVAVALVVALRGGSSATRIAGDALAPVDPETGQVKGSVALGSRPGDVAASGTSVWVTLPDRGAVVQIDARTMTVADTVPVGAAPSGVAAGAG